MKAPIFLLSFILLPILLPGQTPEPEIWQLRDYTNMRLTSTDTTGGNDDGNWANKIQPGETRVLGEVQGPGIIKHIWFTIASDEKYHLKKLVLRIYWDGEDSPSVESPVGDFFGLGLGRYFMYESRYTSVGSQRALNAYFPMPFRESAHITITNEGEMVTDAFYFNIDWEKHSSLPENTAYFHAQYRQAVPTDGVLTDWENNPGVGKLRNKDGAGNYVIMEATGHGHYLGATHSLVLNQGDWWGEGDEMIFIDGAELPQIIGTGAEDYYLGAWCYGGCGINPFGNEKPEFDYLDYGNPRNGGDDKGAQWMVYRFHAESPVVFNSSIRMTIEHGHANHRADNYYTVGYWYQTEPHQAFPEFPAMEERIPTIVDIEGPVMGND